GGALRTRVAELERTRGWLLLILSCAGLPCAMEMLQAIANRRAEEIEGDLAALEQRGLVRREGSGWAPANDSVGEMAIEIARPDSLDVAHKGLARVLSASEGDPGSLTRSARHLIATRDRHGLSLVFVRWLAEERRHGDRRSRRVLAREFLAGVGSASD